jgi:hypothetical protein
MNHEALVRAQQEAKQRVEKYVRWQQEELQHRQALLAEREEFWRRVRPEGSSGDGDFYIAPE